MKMRLFELVGGAIALLAVPTAFDIARTPAHRAAEAPLPFVQTVMLRAGQVTWPAPGEFLVGGRPAAAPRAEVTFRQPLEIMAYQVGAADYLRCVGEGACRALDARVEPAPDLPVTGVSHDDAVAYANWYSRRTGESWRLPTDAEWAYAAGERFGGETSAEADDPANPAIAWIRRYREEAALRRAPDPAPKPAGHFGANAAGLYDIAGNVWEWTSTCYARTTFAKDRKTVESTIENCGVHVVEGRHRTYMSNFVRDAVSGGCAVGTPPDNLGFRLVREPRPLLSLAGLRRLVEDARTGLGRLVEARGRSLS